MEVIFTNSVRSGSLPLIVHFRDTNQDKTILRTWDFDDGTILETYEPNVSHTYGVKNQYDEFYRLGDVVYPKLTTIEGQSFQGDNSISLAGIKEEQRIVFKANDTNLIPSLKDRKLVDYKKYLPSFLEETEMEKVVELFQDYLNNMFYERKEDVTKSISDDELTYEFNNRNKISLLDAIDRIKEYHDPDTVDIYDLPKLANFLGYSVDINKTQLGISENSDSITFEEDTRKYLRLIINSLPDWYRIKTKEETFRILLFSFGFIANVKNAWSIDYENIYKWISDGDINSINTTFNGKLTFPTPHFYIDIKIDNSPENFSTTNNNQVIINAIESIRPVNAVFDGVSGSQTRNASVGYKTIMLQNFAQTLKG